jgi:hypothetical protein
MANEEVKKNLVRVNFFLAGFIAGVVFAIIITVISSGAAPAPDSPLPLNAGRHLTGGLQFLKESLATEDTENCRIKTDNKFSSPSSEQQGGCTPSAVPAVFEEGTHHEGTKDIKN